MRELRAHIKQCMSHWLTVACPEVLLVIVNSAMLSIFGYCICFHIEAFLLFLV